ncbi:MAG: DM13 domain-containing protein [Pseudomonadota bacterium]
MDITRRQFAGLTLAAASTIALGTTTPSLAGSKARKGTLSGRRGYNVSGTVKVKKADGKTKVVLSDNYVFDPTKNPPDIKIGFGNGEKYAKGSKIHDKLTVKKGAATFEVPASVDTDKYDELYIYCEKFTVILAVAPLK